MAQISIYKIIDTFIITPDELIQVRAVLYSHSAYIYGRASRLVLSYFFFLMVLLRP